MAFILADRVKESTTTTGTGTLTLGGAETGYRAFSNVCANGDKVPYAISSSGSSEWEVGYGTYSGGTLSRDNVLASSNSGSLVSFSSGTKDVYLTLVTQRFNKVANAFLDVEFNAASLSLSAGAFTKITGFSVNSDPGSNWSGANDYYIVPYDGIYLIRTLFRLADNVAGNVSYGSAPHTALADFAGFLWNDSSDNVTAARNGQLNIRIAHFTAGDHIFVEAYWDWAGGSSTTVSSCSMNIALLQPDQ